MSDLPRSVKKPHYTAIRNSLRKPAKFQGEVMKSMDLVAFNKSAEMFFVEWLANAISTKPKGSVTTGWVIPNAAFQLNVSIETAKYIY